MAPVSMSRDIRKKNDTLLKAVMAEWLRRWTRNKTIELPFSYCNFHFYSFNGKFKKSKILHLKRENMLYICSAKIDRCEQGSKLRGGISVRKFHLISDISLWIGHYTVVEKWHQFPCQGI
jgi:hypothetical protein